MTYTEQAIKIAIENGWKPMKDRGLSPEWVRVNYVEHHEVGFYMEGGDEGLDASMSFEEICLDPLFWQALGRGLGWGEKDTWYDTNCTCDGGGTHYMLDLHVKGCKKLEAKRDFKFYMHGLVNHLIAEKTIESFFEQLIK